METLGRTQNELLLLLSQPSHCSVCGGTLRIIACVEDPVVIDKILARLGANATAAQASRPPPSLAPPA